MSAFIKNLFRTTLLSLCFTPALHAQIEYIEGERLSIAHGLSSNQVTDILQDSRGFLWIGTDNGLNRYDGYTVKIYKNDPHDSTSLSDNNVNAIYEDRSGRLWIGTRGGLNQFNPYSETFTRYGHDPDYRNSLSANDISAIHQDQSGALWIGIQGVGKQAVLNKLVMPTPVHSSGQGEAPVSPAAHFIRYQLYQDAQEFSQSVFVTFIIEDSSGTVWIGTFNRGLKKFTPQNGVVKHYRHDSNDPNSIAGNRIRSGTIDRLGFLWIGIWDVGVDRLDPRTGEIIHLQHDPTDAGSLPSNIPRSLYTDQDGIIWVGTGTVLSGYDSQVNLISRFTVSPRPNVNYYASDGIGVIFQDRSRILWLGTGKNGLIKINRRPRTFIHYQHNPAASNSLFTNDIQSLFMDRSGKIWITAFGNGISRFDPETEKFKHFRHDPADPSSLGHDYVASFCEDRSGTIWLGTWAGISRFDLKSETFTHFRHEHPDAKEYKVGSVKHIVEGPTGSLWFGTFNGGLYELDYSTPKIKSSGQQSEQSEEIFTSDLLSNSVSMTEEFDPVLKRLQRFIIYKHNSDDSTSLSDNEVRGLYVDRLGHLWVTTANGMNLLNRPSCTFRNITREAGFSESYGPYNRQRFYEDQSGKLWVFSPSLGLCRFDFSKTKSEVFKIVSHALPDDAFSQYDFYEFSEAVAPVHNEAGIIWVTSKYGLHKLDSKAEVFISHYTQEDGLPGTSAGRILGDDQGKLWLLSSEGLSVFDESASAGEKVHHFGVKDGVVNSPYGGFLKGATGNIYWGGGNGLYRFFPENLKNNPHIAPVVLTEFRIFNKTVKLDTTITTIRHIALTHKQNSFSFSFATLDYTSPHQNQYAYVLEGFDNDWIYHDHNTTANYTNIPPGDYVFRVKGTNDSGVWNEEGSSVHITITPPWWRTLWAYSAYVLLIGMSLFIWRNIDIRRTELKNELKLKRFEMEKLQEVDRVKSRFFANISHEFRTPLTLIIDPLDCMASGAFNGDLNAQYGVMRRYAKRLLRLINQLLDLSKLENRMLTLEATRDNVVPLLKGLVNSFESIAAGKNIRLLFKSKLKNIAMWYDRDKLEQVIINLLSNALKFTPDGGEISIIVTILPGDRPLSRPSEEGIGGLCQMSITDTGIGILEDRLSHIFDRFYQVDGSHTRQYEGTGIGLALTKELVELHHGEITVKSREGEGSTFTVRLPLGMDHLQEHEIGDDAIPTETVLKDAPVEKPWEIEGSEEIIEQHSTDLDAKKESESRSRILVVEDNMDVRNYIRQHLESAYEVAEAPDGTAGVEFALKNMPDLIISDVMMPGLDGYALCRTLKNDIRTSHIPIVLLTAKAEDSDKITGLEIGADDYLIKPFNSQELLARIKNLIELRRKLQEKYQREFLLQPDEIAVESLDDEFLKKACEIVKTNMADPEFSVEVFATKIAMSRVNLYRKLRAMVNQSASEFIRSLRLKRAAQLLQHHAGNITEITFQVGFNSTAYFSKCFHDQFGIPPSEYLKKSL